MDRGTRLHRSVGYVESEAEQIYFESIGDGPPLVLCHGLGGNHAIWWQQIETFADRFRVITWDLRGFGNSTLRSDSAGPQAGRRDLAALLSHLGLERISLLGQSLGGWVALGFALEHPQMVESLVLSTTLAGAAPGHVDVLVNAEPGRDRSNRREHPVLGEEFCERHPDLGVLYNQISSFGARPSPQSVLAAMDRDRFSPEAIASLPSRTLVLMATDDALCPPTAMADVADAMPNGRLVEIPGGHSAYYENPEIWNRTVLEFLDERPG